MTSEEFRTNPMFLRNQFKGDGVFEIPKIEKEETELENIELIGYDKLDENETDVVRIYDDQTNTFGVYNSNGETITFFKPSHGQRYFDSQPGK